MAGATLDLPALQALIALGGYGGRGNNDPSTAVLGLSAALFLSDLSIWQGAGDTLTDAEIDDIQELVATLEKDLMVTDDMYPMDRCQIWNSADQLIAPSVLTWLLFNTDVFDPEDMHDPLFESDRIYAQNDGLHFISATVTWDTDPIGLRQLLLYRYRAATTTETNIVGDTMAITPPANWATHLFTWQDYAYAGDYYRLRVRQYSGSNLKILSKSTSPHFNIVRL